jgi:hypothetical protein
MTNRRGSLAGTAVVLAALAVGGSGCAGTPGSAAAAQTARAAVRAAAAHDTATLCGLLARSTVQQLEQDKSAPCAEATRSLDLGSTTSGSTTSGSAVDGAAQVWGRSAMVAVGSATVFLTDVDGRWRVLAAGCALREEQPAQCALGGR